MRYIEIITFSQIQVAIEFSIIFNFQTSLKGKNFTSDEEIYPLHSEESKRGLVSLIIHMIDLVICRVNIDILDDGIHIKQYCSVKFS